CMKGERRGEDGKIRKREWEKDEHGYINPLLHCYNVRLINKTEIPTFFRFSFCYFPSIFP
ncbi:MAG: hypothetical protein V5A59_08650, partial [Bacteroidales bacterium]